ncbi:MAG: DUF2029 domain-containing protein [Scytolyngbya sp. HA4215-MV1]|jgi:hypothetical protein|nr:DUF2029 domain-containing protein [Scytolyngbya sp. HA4215-MV1]
MLIALIDLSKVMIADWQLYVFYFSLLIVTSSLSYVGFRFTQKWNSNWQSQVLMVLPVIGMMIGLFSLAKSLNHLGDFTKAYYPAGKLVVENPQMLYGSNIEGRLGGFVNIPIVAYLLTPFSALDPFNSQLVFTVFSIIIAFASYFLFVDWLKVSGFNQWLILQLFVINGPLYYSIAIGNTTHFLFPIFILILSLMAKNKNFWVGFWLAIAALIKVPLVLFGAYFFLRQQWRSLLGFLVPAIVVPLLSIMIFGFGLHVEWYEKCIKPFSGKALSAFNNQSVSAFVIRLFTTNAPDWYPLEMDLDARIAKYLFFMVLIGGSIWVCWRAKAPKALEMKNLELCIVLTLALLISPISWTHYYLLLLIPYSLYIAGQFGSFRKGKIVIPIALSALLISPPAIKITLANPLINLLISKVLISYYFFGGIMLLGALLWMRYQLRNNPDQSNSILTPFQS